MKHIAIIIIVLSLSVTCLSQVLIKDVDRGRLANMEVGDYLQDQIDQKIEKFSDIQASLLPEEDISGYKMHILEYDYRENLENIWQHYLSLPPGEAWNSHKIKLNLLFSRKDEKLFYADDVIKKMDTEQIIYLDLSFIFGLFRLPMAFEITLIDKENNIIEFSYIKGNISQGKQMMAFHETSNGNSYIEHISYFKSKSFLRDHFLYPRFHKKVTDDFHRNMRKKM